MSSRKLKTMDLSITFANNTAMQIRHYIKDST